MAKTMFVRLAPEFSTAICTDTDPEHPFSPDVVIVAGKGKSKELPVYEVNGNSYIKNKIREGILEEVRDFPADGVPRNDPKHPDHVDNPDAMQSLGAVAAPATAPQSGYSEDQVKAMIADALQAQSAANTDAQNKATADQNKATADAVQRALTAQQEKNKADMSAAIADAVAKAKADLDTQAK